MNQILVTRCYSEITPESAADGDVSDYGLVYAHQAMTFRELVEEIWQGGFMLERGADWLSTGYSVEDYRTGTAREETLHYSMTNPTRMEKYFWLAVKASERRARRRSDAAERHSDQLLKEAGML